MRTEPRSDVDSTLDVGLHNALWVESMTSVPMRALPRGLVQLLLVLVLTTSSAASALKLLRERMLICTPLQRRQHTSGV